MSQGVGSKLFWVIFAHTLALFFELPTSLLLGFPFVHLVLIWWGLSSLAVLAVVPVVGCKQVLPPIQNDSMGYDSSLSERHASFRFLFFPELDFLLLWSMTLRRLRTQAADQSRWEPKGPIICGHRCSFRKRRKNIQSKIQSPKLKRINESKR